MNNTCFLITELKSCLWHDTLWVIRKGKDYGIKKGDTLYHRQYGDAKVKSIDGEKITLEFKDDIDRSFSLRVLMENNLIILIK